MESVRMLRRTCRMLGMALIVLGAPIALHLLRLDPTARAQEPTVAQGPAGAQTADDLLLLPTQVAEPNAVSGGALTAPLSFVGIAPCRIVDTRAGQGFSGAFGPPALVANASRTFQITGTTTGTPQQCGIPDAAVAISVNFTVTGFGGAGDIRVYPAGTTAPLASILNYSLENIANATTVPLGASGSGHNGISVMADASATEFIADVNGYYLPASTLASGQTLKGSYFAGDANASAASEFFSTSVSFTPALTVSASASAANFIPAGGAATANCPGSAANPLAAAGQFCVYERTAVNRTLSCLYKSSTWACGSTDTFGGGIAFFSAAAGTAYSAGTWAVTAP